MKVTKKVNAPASYIYKQLIKSSINDIKGATDTILTEDQLEGFSYRKVFVNKHQAKIEILAVKKNELYQFRTTTKLREFDTTYSLRSLSEHTCEIHIEEKVITKGIMLKYNDIIMEIISGRSRKKHFALSMEALASTYSPG